MGNTKFLVGRNVRERRIKLGLTQDQLAEASELSHTGIQRIEAGTRLPRADNLELIAKALDWQVHQLFMPDPYAAATNIPPDIAERLQNADELDLRLVRRALGLPDSTAKKERKELA